MVDLCAVRDSDLEFVPVPNQKAMLRRIPMPVIRSFKFSLGKGYKNNDVTGTPLATWGLSLSEL